MTALPQEKFLQQCRFFDAHRIGMIQIFTERIVTLHQNMHRTEHHIRRNAAVSADLIAGHGTLSVIGHKRDDAVFGKQQKQFIETVQLQSCFRQKLLFRVRFLVAERQNQPLSVLGAECFHHLGDHRRCRLHLFNQRIFDDAHNSVIIPDFHAERSADAQITARLAFRLNTAIARFRKIDALPHREKVFSKLAVKMIIGIAASAKCRP